jgi:hypothetical protein
MAVRLNTTSIPQVRSRDLVPSYLSRRAAALRPSCRQATAAPSVIPHGRHNVLQRSLRIVRIALARFFPIPLTSSRTSCSASQSGPMASRCPKFITRRSTRICAASIRIIAYLFLIACWRRTMDPRSKPSSACTVTRSTCRAARRTYLTEIDSRCGLSGSCRRREKPTAGAKASTNTESQMIAMFGWIDPKMPAHYIAKANREKAGMTGVDKIVAFDQSQSLDNFIDQPEDVRRDRSGNIPGQLPERSLTISMLVVGMVRSEGLEPPRCYSLPPQGSASTNSATSAWDAGRNL